MDSLLPSESAAKVMSKDSACPSLTGKQRLYGFLVCFIIGLLLSICSIGGILFVSSAPEKFAFICSAGTICSLASTFFFMGPKSQFKKMFDKTRIVASILLIISIVGTIAFAFFYDGEKGLHKLIMLILIGVQIFFMFWYSLSYVPFGRKIFKNICGKICGDSDEES